MSNTTTNKANIAEHIKSRQLDKERHQRLAEAMDDAVKVLEAAAEAVKQGQWDERLGAVLTALESKEKPSIPFALGSLGLESVPEALMNEEHKEGVELFRSLLAQRTEEGNLQLEAKEQVSPRRQRTRSTNEVTVPSSRYHLDLEKTLFPRLRHALSILTKDKISIPFRRPVTLAEAPNYYDVITNPMDLSTMRKKLDKGVYKSPQEFLQDLLLICENAFRYNSKHSEVYELAKELKKAIKKLMEPVLEEWSSIVQVLEEAEGKENNEVPISEARESDVTPEPSRKTRKRNNATNRDSKASETASIATATEEVQENTTTNSVNTVVVGAISNEKDTGITTIKDEGRENLKDVKVENKLEQKDNKFTEASVEVASKDIASEANNTADDGERVTETATADTTNSQLTRKRLGKKDTTEVKSRSYSSRSKKRSRVRR